MIASAAEEMSSTINEIAENAECARNVSSKAVDQAKIASDKIGELGGDGEKNRHGNRSNAANHLLKAPVKRRMAGNGSYL